MYRASCPLASRGISAYFEHDAVFHQLATHLQGFLSQVADGGRGADSSRQAASREDGIPYGLAGSHSGHPDAGQVKAQDPASDISALAHEIRALREKETQHAAIG